MKRAAIPRPGRRYHECKGLVAENRRVKNDSFAEEGDLAGSQIVDRSDAADPLFYNRLSKGMVRFGSWVHVFADVHDHLIVGVEPDESKARKFVIEDDIDRKG